MLTKPSNNDSAKNTSRVRTPLGECGAAWGWSRR